LREARLRAGLTQGALAERSGKDRVQINRYEAGAVAPNVDTLIELVRACGFDLPLELVPFQVSGDDDLSKVQNLSPERRLERMLDRAARPARSFDPVEVLAALERNYVDYVLIGGLAQVLRGADQVTSGVDICPSFAKDNLARLEAAIRELNTGADTQHPLALNARSMASEPIMKVATGAGELNVVCSPSGVPNGYVDLRRAATREDLGHGVRPLVASTGDLAAMAATLQRDKDLERLPVLRHIVELEARPQQPVQRRSQPPRMAQRRAARPGPQITP